MLIYPEPLVSRTHGLQLPEGVGNEAGWDAPPGDLTRVCQARRTDSLTPVLGGTPAPARRASPQPLQLLTESIPASSPEACQCRPHSITVCLPKASQCHP